MTVYKFNENVTPKPQPQARKGEGRMKAADVQSVMHGLVQDAINLVDGELSPERALATDYYLGKPFGNEEEGRSQIVITEVRDTVHGVLPSLMRIFTGPDRAVEFSARTEPGVAGAEQATDYAQYVFMEDNKGFLRTYDVLKDGLVRKLGVFKYYWDAASERSYREEGLSDDEVQLLAARDDVTITEATESDEDAGYGDDDAPLDAPPGATGKRWDVEYTVKIEGKPCVIAVPPEEILFNREARDPDQALMLAHRTRLRRGDLVALGIDEDDIDEYGQPDHSLGTNIEAVERNLNVNVQQGQDPEAGDANDLVLYIEAYVHLDVNGDGEAELRRVLMIGPSYHVVRNEPVDDHCFTFFTPYPEPHTMLGQSMADLTMDVQLVKSSITRSMNDSLALSIYNRTAFVDGMASVEDILNNEIGAPIRMKAPGMVQPFSHEFTGDKAMSVLEYFDAVSENRTGRNKGALGLDADALQSSTDGAVEAAVASSQEQTEMLARIFAEQTFKPLFRGIYKLLVKHRPAPRLIKLRGQYVKIDTSAWDADMDVTVNVALGTTDTGKRLARLQAIADKQEQILQTMGMQNPLVTMAQYATTLRKIVELGGERAVSAYFNAVDPNWQPPPAPPPPPTPEQVIAQAQIQNEQLKTQKDLEIKRAELSLKQQRDEFDRELKIRQMAQDFVLRRYQIDAQFKADYSQADLERDAAAEEAALKGATSIIDMQHRHRMERGRLALDTQDQAHDQALSRADLELQAEAQRAAGQPDDASSANDTAG